MSLPRLSSLSLPSDPVVTSHLSLSDLPFRSPLSLSDLLSPLSRLVEKSVTFLGTPQKRHTFTLAATFSSVTGGPDPTRPLPRPQRACKPLRQPARATSRPRACPLPSLPSHFLRLCKNLREEAGAGCERVGARRGDGCALERREGNSGRATAHNPLPFITPPPSHIPAPSYLHRNWEIGAHPTGQEGGRGAPRKGFDRSLLVCGK